MAKIYAHGESVDTNGRYVVEYEIAGGGEGFMYSARDSRSAQLFAIKVLDPSKAKDPESARLQLLERNQLQIDHPCVISSVDSGPTVCGSSFVAFPYLEGYCRFGSIITKRQQETFGFQSICWVLYQIVAGVLAMARRGYVHGDIKPANVMVEPVSLAAVLIDLGMADKSGAPRSPYNGTLEWKAPERFQNAPALPESDQAEVGYLAYFALSKVLPYDPDDVAGSLKARRLKPLHQINSDIPRDLSDAVARATDNDLGRRFDSLESLLVILRPYLPTEHRHGCERCQFVQDTSFCSRCGRDLNDHTARYRCASCGYDLSATVKNCNGCGSRIHPHSPRIAFSSGLLGGLTLLFPEGAYITGRQCIEPRNLSISRSHLRVEAKDGRVMVADAQAKKPMKLNGRPIACPVPLILNTPISLAGCAGRVVGG